MVRPLLGPGQGLCHRLLLDVWGFEELVILAANNSSSLRRNILVGTV